MILEIRQLRYFRAVAEELNFHRAAAKLHVAQPALSRQIHALELTLGVILFERQPRGVALSPSGQVFLEDTRRILNELTRAQERVRRVSQGQLGTVRIGFNEIAARKPYLPGLFKATRARFPDVEMKLTLLTSQPQIEALRTGEIDAGFLFHRPPGDSDLLALAIDDDDYAIAMPSNHKLAARPHIHLADVRDEPFIMMSQHANRVLYDKLMAACVAGGLVPRQVHEANNEFAIVNLVAAGVGLAFINRSFTHPVSDVVLRVVDDLSVPVQLELVWRRDNRSPALARFVESVASSEQVRRRPARDTGTALAAGAIGIGR
jgi:DNA-binding transcriptional LysR family regulator